MDNGSKISDKNKKVTMNIYRWFCVENIKKDKHMYQQISYHNYNNERVRKCFLNCLNGSVAIQECQPHLCHTLISLKQNHILA